MLCELTDAVAVDIMHIYPRQRGGSENMDFIENLMAGSREVHNLHGDNKNSRLMLLEAHERKLIEHGKPYDKEIMDKLKQRAIAQSMKYETE